MSWAYYLLQTTARGAAQKLGEAAVIGVTGYVGYKLFRHKNDKERRDMGQEQIKVLEMVASGTISPAEGERLLAALSASHAPRRGRSLIDLPEVKLPRIDLSPLGQVAMELKNTVVDTVHVAQGKVRESRVGPFFEPKKYDIAGPSAEGVTSCALELDISAGKLKLQAGDAGGSLIAGKVIRVPEAPQIESNVQDGRAEVTLKHSMGRATLQLNPAPLYELKLNSAASDALLNLTELKVSSLELDNNAGSVEVRLGAELPKLHASVHSNAGWVKLHIPGSHALRVVSSSTLGSTNVEGLGLKPFNGGLQSTDWDHNDKRAEVVLVQNVASFELAWKRQPGEGMMEVVPAQNNGEVPAAEL